MIRAWLGRMGAAVAACLNVWPSVGIAYFIGRPVNGPSPHGQPRLLATRSPARISAGRSRTRAYNNALRVAMWYGEGVLEASNGGLRKAPHDPAVAGDGKSGVAAGRRSGLPAAADRLLRTIDVMIGADEVCLRSA